MKGGQIKYHVQKNTEGKEVALFRIFLKPGRFHSDPVKNAEAEAILRKTEELCKKKHWFDEKGKLLESSSKNYGKPNGPGFYKTNSEYHGGTEY